MFTYSIKRAREIRKFHVAVVQRRLRNVQKKCDARAKLLFCLLTHLPFCRFHCRRRRRRRRRYLSSLLLWSRNYHGNVTSHFSSLLIVMVFTDSFRARSQTLWAPPHLTLHSISLHSTLHKTKYACTERQKRRNEIPRFYKAVSLMHRLKKNSFNSDLPHGNPL